MLAPLAMKNAEHEELVKIILKRIEKNPAKFTRATPVMLLHLLGEAVLIKHGLFVHRLDPLKSKNDSIFETTFFPLGKNAKTLKRYTLMTDGKSFTPECMVGVTDGHARTVLFKAPPTLVLKEARLPNLKKIKDKARYLWWLDSPEYIDDFITQFRPLLERAMSAWNDGSRERMKIVKERAARANDSAVEII